MKIFVEPDEASERLEEPIELAWRRDVVVICRAGQPIAVLAAMAAERRPTINDQTSNHDEFYDENGLPK